MRGGRCVDGARMGTIIPRRCPIVYRGKTRCGTQRGRTADRTSGSRGIWVVIKQRVPDLGELGVLDKRLLGWALVGINETVSKLTCRAWRPIFAAKYRQQP